MRVLAMLHLYTPHHCAGAEMAVHALLRALVAHGHTVDVLLSRSHPGVTTSYLVDGVRVHPRVNKGDPVRWLSDPDTRPHLLVTHLENTDRASILGRTFRVPVVHVLHNTFPTTKYALKRQPALAVSNSRWMLDDIARWWDIERGGTPMPPTIIVRPPVDPEDYRTSSGAHVTLVNMTAEKGAEVFYALAERFPRVRFLAVEGAYGEQDRRERPNVTWCPHTARMRERVYRRTRVLLMPSAYESYGRVGVEAACSGIPTIAHPTPGLRESLGDAGIFADRADLGVWVEQLQRLLSPTGWAASSARALRLADRLDTKTDLDRWVSTVEAVSRDAAGNRR